jgi:hypothetical protein
MKQFVFDGERIGPWVHERAGGHYVPGSAGIAIERDGELVVGVTYDSYTGSNIIIHSRCDDPKATSRRFYWMIFDYPFNQLGVTCVRGLVSTGNAHAQEINGRLGFQGEAMLKDYFPDGDAIIYVMRRENCRFLALGERYANRMVAKAA